jgi:hypothetical protein
MMIEGLSEFSNSFINLIVATSDARQMISEFSAEIISLRNRYHPFVWWFMIVYINIILFYEAYVKK